MCDTLVSLAGDGVLFAKNSDRDPDEAQLLEWTPAADHRPGTRLACTWIEIDQVGHTHATVVSRPWWMWGAEMGANEHGVVIGNEAVFTRGGYGDPALLGMDLVRLALERATTAAEAVGVLVELLERHGQGGPCSRERPAFTYDNSFLVADPDGAVVLETAGRSWASETVTGPGRSISNGLTIPAFARAHGRRVRTWVAAAARRRRHRAPGLPGRRTGRPVRRPPQPREQPGATVVAAARGLSAPCVHAGGLLRSSQTTASWVADLRHRPSHWVTATAAPCTGLFLPVDVATPLALGPAPTATFDARTLWWRHELLHRAVLTDHGRLLGTYRHERDEVEAAWLAAPPAPGPAVAEADRLRARWLQRVLAHPGPDRRPRHVRSTWTAADRAAGLERPPAGAGCAATGP